MPPVGTKNPQLIHGSHHASSIGTAATHGCLRLGAEGLAFIYSRVPIGTPVHIM
ncbi:MAG: L,D-transpeptidase [Gemmatimonadaceae bacterium]|nr:L,D-transpeptidase [Gemmatimonadaceae bacterium]